MAPSPRAATTKVARTAERPDGGHSLGVPGGAHVAEPRQAGLAQHCRLGRVIASRYGGESCTWFDDRQEFGGMLPGATKLQAAAPAILTQPWRQQRLRLSTPRRSSASAHFLSSGRRVTSAGAGSSAARDPPGCRRVPEVPPGRWALATMGGRDAGTAKAGSGCRYIRQLGSVISTCSAAIYPLRDGPMTRRVLASSSHVCTATPDFQVAGSRPTPRAAPAVSRAPQSPPIDST